MIRIFLMAVAFQGVNAFAYGEGRYTCKNSPGLPDNVYVIKKVSIGADGDRLPHIEATRFFREDRGDQNSKVIKAKIVGIATVFSSEISPETLAVGALRLEFSGDELPGCTR